MDSSWTNGSPVLSPDGCTLRREALCTSVDADLIVLTNPRHLFYYAGFCPEAPSHARWGPAYLLVETTTRESTLICHNTAGRAAREACVDHREIWTWYDAATRPGISIFPEAVRRLRVAIADRSPRRLGVEAGWFPALDVVTAGDAPDAVHGLVDITSAIEAQRRRKQPDELELIRFAQWVTEAGYEAARSELRAGMTEMELYSIVQSAMTGRSGRPVKLIGDFLSGERTMRPSGPATSRAIRPGDTVILDLGPVVNGYRSDCTATLVLADEVPPRQRELETALHAALAAGEEKLRPGTRCADLHGAVKDVLCDHGFGDHFEHHAGHGLGLDHPEAPYLVPESDEALLEGDVVTLEPGAYAKEFAGRIEHIYLVTSEGFERLSNHSTAFAL